MHKITKGLKKKKKGKKSKHKEEELFKPEELEAYRQQHQQQVAEEQDSTSAAPPAAGVDNDEWKKFNALTAGVDSILKKTQDDLSRIKGTSFFQRIPLASETKAKEEEEQKQLQKQQEEEREEASHISATDAAIVAVSESESEEEDEDDIFDTTYLDSDIKLAYIPESPTYEQDNGDDPFDTSIAERAILGPASEKRGKKLVPIGSAVEVLTGRVQAYSCVPTKRPTSRRVLAHQQPNLLLGENEVASESNTDTLVALQCTKGVVEIYFRYKKCEKQDIY